jgi:dCMP deaminase
MLKIAEVLSWRGTCVKLAVGCVLVDEHNRIIGAGYNGVPRGLPHCFGEQSCPGASMAKGSDTCEAVHAEQNALLTCRSIDHLATAYVTHAPCLRCTKTLLNTNCNAIVFTEDSFVEPAAENLWRKAGRTWTHYKDSHES